MLWMGGSRSCGDLDAILEAGAANDVRKVFGAVR